MGCSGTASVRHHPYHLVSGSELSAVLSPIFFSCPTYPVQVFARYRWRDQFLCGLRQLNTSSLVAETLAKHIYWYRIMHHNDEAANKV